jgi:hypothetical protein
MSMSMGASKRGRAKIVSLITILRRDTDVQAAATQEGEVDPVLELQSLIIVART